MENYNSIDDALEVPEIDVKLPENIKKETHFNPFYSPLTNLGLIATLLIAGCVAAPRASAQDIKQSYGTEQTVKQDIDLSQYTKVAEQDGLEVYVSKIRRNPNNWDSVVEKDYARKWINYAYFFDLYIRNNSDKGLTLDREIIKSLTGKVSEREIKSEEFLKWYLSYSKDPNKVYIPANGDITLPDNGYMTCDSNKKIMITFYGKNDFNIPFNVALQIKIN